MSLCVSPHPASLRTSSGLMFGTMLSASSRSSLAVASLLMGTRARDGGGRQNRGKAGLTTQENECEKGKLRLRENRRYSATLRPSRADCFSARTSRIVSRACSGVMIGSTVSPDTARAKCSISRE